MAETYHVQYTSKPEPKWHHITIVGAADVEADGYTGKDKYISGVSTTAEGKCKVTFREVHDGLVNSVISLDSTSLSCSVESETLSSSDDPSINLVFTSIVTDSSVEATSTDPDSLTIKCSFLIDN